MSAVAIASPAELIQDCEALATLLAMQDLGLYTT